MFEKLKMFGKAYKTLRAAEKSGLSRKDAKMQVFSDIIEEVIPDLDGMDEIEIDGAALHFTQLACAQAMLEHGRITF